MEKLHNTWDFRHPGHKKKHHMQGQYIGNAKESGQHIFTK